MDSDSTQIHTPEPVSRFRIPRPRPRSRSTHRLNRSRPGAARISAGMETGMETETVPGMTSEAGSGDLHGYDYLRPAGRDGDGDGTVDVPNPARNSYPALETRGKDEDEENDGREEMEMEMKCCCGRPASSCAFLSRNHSALRTVERDLDVAARLGQVRFLFFSFFLLYIWFCFFIWFLWVGWLVYFGVVGGVASV